MDGLPFGPSVASTPTDLLPSIGRLWERDGLRLLEFRWTRDQKRMWRDSYYVRTFSEYTMDAVRRLVDRSRGESAVS